MRWLTFWWTLAGYSVFHLETSPSIPLRTVPSTGGNQPNSYIPTAKSSRGNLEQNTRPPEPGGRRPIMEEEGKSLHKTIFERCLDTRRQFVDLLSKLEDHQVQKVVLSDSLERFMLWAGNLGAMRQPSSKLSLDQRLIRAPEVHGLIFQHVGDIHEAVGDLFGVLLQDGAPENDYQETLGPGPDAEEPFDEPGMLLEVIAEAISSLFRLGILVRKSSSTDRFKRALQMSDISFDDTFDIGYVSEKYPKMRDPEKGWLTSRLGRLISQRRLFIKYSRDHKARLEYQEPLRGEISEEHATQTQRQSSKATTFHLDRLPASVLAPSPPDLEDVPQLEEEDIDEVVSVMSASTMSNALSVLKLPALADLSADGQAFECPICFTLQHFQREKAWKTHAFRDLKAYVCTAGESDRCNEEYFGDRNTWFEHELYYHRAKYICAICQDQQPIPYSAFSQHMSANHPQVPGNHLRGIEEGSRRIPTYLNANDCPFCDDWAEQIRQNADPKGKRPVLPTHLSDSPCMVSTVRFKRHVALHQEQLAIFALPRMVEGGDQADDGGTDKSIVSSESASAHQSQVSRDTDNPLLNYIYKAAKEAQMMVENQDLKGVIAPKPNYSIEHTDFLKRLALRMQKMEEGAKLLISNIDNDERSFPTEFAVNLWALERERRQEIGRLAVEVERLKSSPSHGTESHAILCRKVADEIENTTRLVNAWSDNRDFEKFMPGWGATDEDISRMELLKAWDELADIITRHYTAPSDTATDNALILKRPVVKFIQATRIDLGAPEDPPLGTSASTTEMDHLITIMSPSIRRALQLAPNCSWQEADAIIKAAHVEDDGQPKSKFQALVQQGCYTLMLAGPDDSYLRIVNQGNWKNLIGPGSFLRLLPAYGPRDLRAEDKRSAAPEAESEGYQEAFEHFAGAATGAEEGGAPVRETGDEQEELWGDESPLINSVHGRGQETADGDMKKSGLSISHGTAVSGDAALESSPAYLPEKVKAKVREVSNTVLQVLCRDGETKRLNSDI